MTNGKLINYLAYPESDVIINYIHERFRKGLYSHVPISGLPGTGKSSTCQRLAELVYKKLDNGMKLKADDIVDSLLDFLKRLKAVKQPGEIIIIEEVSVLFPSRRAMAKENVAIGRVLDTCRKKQVILFSNAPIFSSIDSHIRAMSHVLMETQKIVKHQQVVVCKAWRLQTNPHTGKTYRHRFTRNGRDVGLFYAKKPDADVWDEYEKNKDNFMNELYNDLTLEQQKKKEKKDKELGRRVRAPVKMLTELELRVHNMVNIRKMSQTAAALELDRHPSQISKIIKNIDKKSKIPSENDDMVSQNNPASAVN